jgi:hypothetical protein
MLSKHLILGVLLGSLGSNSICMAQENLTLKAQENIDNKKPEGWHPRLLLKGNLSMGSSKSVVGQVDGDSTTLGANIDSGLDYKKELNEWRQTLTYSGATTRTPSIPQYVKSSDEFKYSTIFLRGLTAYPNVGPYARLEAKTSLFKGEDVRAESKAYLLKNSNENLGTHNVYRLTDSFIPLTTQESVGFFAKLIENKNTLLELRLGFGAIQVKTKGQLRVNDDANTANIIEVSALDDLSQSGIEYGFVFKGKWNANSDYSLTGDFLTPIGTEVDAGKECGDCDSLALTNVDLKAAITSKVSDWMNISYEYKALKQPEVLDKFQIQHGFVLNILYDIFK